MHLNNVVVLYHTLCKQKHLGCLALALNNLLLILYKDKKLTLVPDMRYGLIYKMWALYTVYIFIVVFMSVL